MLSVLRRAYAREVRRLGPLALCLLAALALGAQVTGAAPTASAASALTTPNFTNEGVSLTDGVKETANYDGGGYSYSNVALMADGFRSGAPVETQGVTFQWPTIATGQDDNWQAAGQVIPIPAAIGSGGQLALLGSSTNGPSSGSAIIRYSDGSQQTFTLSFSDWTLNGGSAGVMSGNTIVATMPYRDQPTGSKQTVKTYLFYTAVAMFGGKTAVSVTLPSSANRGHLHVFTIGGNTGPYHASFNNEGVSPADGVRTSANYDGGGYNYSNVALAAQGVTSGHTVTANSVTFQWPTIANGSADNWVVAGQYIPITLTGGGALAFLGSATNGLSSGVVTIGYTDGSTQQATLTFSDWTLSAGAAPLVDGDIIVATMPYRDFNSGARQNVTTYLFYTSVATTPGKTVASVTLPSSVTGGHLHVFAVGGDGPPTQPASPATWPTYLGGVDHTGFNSAETILNSSTFAALQLKWRAHAGGAVSVQPVESNGVIYWGSWDGTMHATNLAGANIWTRNLGQNHDTACFPPTVGIASTATISVIGSTSVVFVGGGDAYFYALNANTGAVLWRTSLGAEPAHFIWGSPTVYNGSVYIGIASFGDCPLVQGGLYQLNATTGAVSHFFKAVPDGCVGVGIWSTPTIDVATNTLYVATGNGGACASSEPFSDSILALHTADLSLISSWQVPRSQQTGDGDFGSSPTLFTAGSRQLLGVANKNGYYYALDRTNLPEGPVWEERIAFDASDCPQCGDGSISPSAWDGSTLYVAGGNTIINGATCLGSVRAVVPATGAVLWAHCLLGGPVLGALTAVHGVVLAVQGPWVNALNSATGATIYSFEDPDHATMFMGAVTVVNGWLYAASGSGYFYAFSL